MTKKRLSFVVVHKPTEGIRELNQDFPFLQTTSTNPNHKLLAVGGRAELKLESLRDILLRSRRSANAKCGNRRGRLRPDE